MFYTGVVHLCGGSAALVAAFMLGPRIGRYTKYEDMQPGNAMNILLGTFFLWSVLLFYKNCGKKCIKCTCLYLIPYGYL